MYIILYIHFERCGFVFKELHLYVFMSTSHVLTKRVLWTDQYLVTIDQSFNVNLPGQTIPQVQLLDYPVGYKYIVTCRLPLYRCHKDSTHMTFTQCLKQLCNIFIFINILCMFCFISPKYHSVTILSNSFDRKWNCMTNLQQ